MRMETPETRALRRDVGRRRRYVENLTRSIAEAGDDPVAADVLRRIIARERDAMDTGKVEIALLEEKAWNRAHGVSDDPEQAERGRRALAAMAGRFMVDRVAAMVERVGAVVPQQAHSVGDRVAAIEARLGIEPPRGATVGRRMDAVERHVGGGRDGCTH